MIDIVKRAELFATEAHEGQTRKYTDEPYINHPRRVAETVSKYTKSLHMVVAAWLHDTIEDCNVTYEEIDREFGTYVAYLVWGLTDQANPAWNRATRTAWEAGRLYMCGADIQTIKVSDLKDNTSDIAANNPKFAKVYIPEKEVLLYGLEDAHHELRAIAFAQIDEIKKELGI